MDIIYVKYTRERIPQFQIKTTIYEENGEYFAKKKALYEEGKNHIKNIYNNYVKLIGNYKNVNISKPILKDDEIIFEYEEGKTVDKILIDLIVKNDKIGFFEKVNWYKSFVENLGDENYVNFEHIEGFINIFGTYDKLIGLKCLNISNIDLSFDNLIQSDQNLINMIDYEWVFDFPIPIDFLIYRSINNFYFKNIKYTEDFIDISTIFDLLGIKKEYIKIYESMLKKFHDYVFVKNNIDNYMIHNKYLKKSNLIEQNKNNIYNVQVFIDENSGFCEENSIIKEINLDENDSIKKFQFNISKFKSIRSLRIDPINTNCVISINKLILIDEELNNIEVKKFITNAEYIFDDKYIFLNNDPQIIINNLDLKKYKKIIINIEFLDGNYEIKPYMVDLYNSLTNNKNYLINLEEKDKEIEEKDKEIEKKDKEIEEKIKK